MNHKKYYKKDLYNVAKQFKNQHNVKGISKLKAEELYNLLNQHNIRLPTRQKGQQVRKPNKNQLRRDYEEFEKLDIYTNPTRAQKIAFVRRMHKKYKNYYTVKNNPFPKGSEEHNFLLVLSDTDMFDFSLEKDIKKAKLQRHIKKRPFLKTPKTSVKSAIQRRKYIKKKPIKKKPRKRIQAHIEKPFTFTRKKGDKPRVKVRRNMKILNEMYPKIPAYIFKHKATKNIYMDLLDMKLILLDELRSRGVTKIARTAKELEDIMENHYKKTGDDPTYIYYDVINAVEEAKEIFKTKMSYKKNRKLKIEKPYSYRRIRKYETNPMFDKTNPMFDDDYTPRFKPSKQHEVEFTKKRMKLAGMDDEGFISYPYTPKKD